MSDLYRPALNHCNAKKRCPSFTAGSGSPPSRRKKRFSPAGIAAYILLSSLLLPVNQQAEAETAPVHTCEVIDVFPHDGTAFTQGLSYADGLLLEGTGLYGESRLIRRTLSGEVLNQHRLPDHLFGEGITVFGDRIFQLTWKANIGIIYDTSFNIKGSFSYPTEGWGLTHDGQDLIMSDGGATLHFINPETFTLKRRLTVTDNGTPVTMLNELEYIRGKIWANIWKKNLLVIIDPQSGRVTAKVDCTSIAQQESAGGKENVLNGIAYDAINDRMFITGKRWSTLFQIGVFDNTTLRDPSATPQGEESK